jgi:hypothetical protein
MHPDNGRDVPGLLLICDACPVRAECDEAGRDETFGIWGGKDRGSRERQREYQRRYYLQRKQESA